MEHQQNKSILSAGLIGPAVRESFTKLGPRQLVRNPVMFTTALVAILATVLTLRKILIGGDIGFEAQIVFWLWLTVLFGNFAEALAEGRGKAQAASLRSTKAELKGMAERNAEEAKRLQDRMERLKADRQALEAAQEAHEKRVAEQEDEIMKREQKVEAMEQEMAHGIEAIGDLVVQAETGEFSIENGKSRLARMPQFIERLLGTEEEKRSPVQSLFAKVVGLLHRVVYARGAEDPSERAENEISGPNPEW